nr:hypothetical protein [Tanacetum cinerariifolium]
MYVVDLQRNVYYQKCYDLDCRGYRSPFCVVPLDVMFKYFRIVMYVVDLQRNVYYQKCYDLDCRGYRSPFCVVPPDVMFKSFRIGEQNESQMDRHEKDDWWFEHNENRDEDDNWWMSAETTALEIECA